MKLDNIEKSSAELLEFIDNLIKDIPELPQNEVNENVQKILKAISEEQDGSH